MQCWGAGREEPAARKARATRVHLALAATAGSVVQAAIVDGTEGPVRWWAGGAVAALMAGALLARWRAAPELGSGRRLSLEQLLLVAVSLGAAAYTLEAASGWLESWRYTAATVAATAPNWYTAAANLLPPPKRGGRLAPPGMAA